MSKLCTAAISLALVAGCAVPSYPVDDALAENEPPVRVYEPHPYQELREASLAFAESCASDTQAALSLVGKDLALEIAKSMAVAHFKDPDSAMFRNLRFVNHADGKLVCGEVNGRNSFGAYVGYRRFLGGYCLPQLEQKHEDPGFIMAANAALYEVCGF